MSLNDQITNKNVEIVAINCDEALRNRFYSFGIIKGSNVCVTGKSLGKKTIEIKINNSKIALRACEASKIEVKDAC